MREICSKCHQIVRDRSWRMLLPGASYVACKCGTILRVRHFGKISSLDQLLSAEHYSDTIAFTEPFPWTKISYDQGLRLLPERVARRWVQLTTLQMLALREERCFRGFWVSGYWNTHAILAGFNGKIVGYLIWSASNSAFRHPVLLQIYILPDYRRRKLATLMIQHWVCNCVAPSSTRFGVSLPNETCLKLLAQSGFTWPDQTIAEYLLPRRGVTRRAISKKPQMESH